MTPSFLTLWAAYDARIPVFEYHFARAVVGDAPGMRKRLTAAGLHDWRFDYAWPALKVAVEFDGGQWVAHGGRHNRDSDREKLNAAGALGWRVLQFSNQQWERNSEGCIRIIKQALGG